MESIEKQLKRISETQPYVVARTEAITRLSLILYEKVKEARKELQTNATEEALALLTCYQLTIAEAVKEAIQEARRAQK